MGEPKAHATGVSGDDNQTAVAVTLGEPADGKGDQLAPLPQNVEPERKAAGESTATVDSCSYWKLYSLADRVDVALVLVGLIGACGAGIMMPLFTIVFSDFINAFGGPLNLDDFSSTVSKLALKFLYLAIGAFFAMWLEVACFTLAAERQTLRLRERFLAAILAQDVAFFDTDVTTGGLLQGLNEDSYNVQAAIGDKASNFVHHMSTFISGIIVAMSYGWDMTLVLLACVPFLGAAGAFMAHVATKVTKINSEAYAEASTVAQQAVGAVRTVAAYNGQASVLAAYTASLTKPLKAGIRACFWIGVSLGSLQFSMYATYALALWYGVQRIAAGKYDGGQVSLVLFSVLMGAFSLGQAGPSMQKFAAGRVSGQRLFAIIERKPRLRDVGRLLDGTTHQHHDDEEKDEKHIAPHGGTGTLATVEGRLEMRDVQFAYPARPDIMVFRGFNLEVPAGHTVALVGSSGSGKSTAIQLLERFYDPAAGSIALDGVDLRALTLAWFRDQIGLVSQEPTLFATTIYENIAMGRPGASEADVHAAAAAANAHKFISALPEGYKTQVGERGVQLSGGQKQRIAIARAVLKNPKILLLDEATSALDTQSERVVQAALDRMVVGRTTVVVAHRLSTIRHAHKIAVVSGGQVVEQGSHDALLADPNGAYSLLVQMQMAAAAKREEAPEGSSGRDSDDEEAVDLPVKVGEGSEVILPVLPAAAVIELAQSGRPGSAATASGELRAGSLTVDKAPGAGLSKAKSTAFLDAKAKEKEQQAKDEAAAKAVPFKRLLMLNRPEWHALAGGSVTSFVAGLQHPAFAFLLSDMITIFYYTDYDKMKRKATFYAGMFVIVAVVALASVCAQQLCFGFAGQRLAMRIRTMLLGAILRQEIAFFDQDENNSGRLTSALATDAAYVRGAVGDAAGVALQNLSTLALGYVISLAYNWQMALVITGAFPIVALSMVLQMQWIAGASATSDKLYGGANQYVGESLSSIRVVHAYNLAGYVTRQYSAMLAETRPTLNRQAHISGAAMGFSFATIFGLYGLIVYFGGWQLEHGHATFNEFLKGFLGVLFSAMGLSQVGLVFPDLGKAAGAIGRIFPILDRKPAIDPDAPGEERADASVQGEVEFRGIVFAYPSRPSVQIYTDFNLTIPPGKAYALVGESGSGKSTVVALLLRFYAPSAGAVLLDGTDIASYQLRWLRRQLGLVSQEPVLFAGTVRDNIAYGLEGAALAEVEAAARVANAHEFIARLPEGYNTQVGEGGIQLSGGQKQRIAIARAVLKNPKVLLLDEATSALDARSERVVQEALDVVMQDRTCLVIAHRLSTVRNAHAISVLYNGAILEQGTHNELMAIPGGAYAKLVAAQAARHDGTTA